MSIKNMGKRDEDTNNTEGVRVELIAMEFERTRPDFFIAVDVVAVY